MFTTISPAIDRYVATEAALNQGNNPISNGTVKGIEAAKSSLSLAPLVQPVITRPSPAMRMISSIPAHFRTPLPGTGRAGMLQSLAQAMGPAAQEYYNELDAQNAIQMRLAEEQNKHTERELERQYRKELLKEQMLMRQQYLGETARHHRALEEEKGWDRRQYQKYEELEEKLGPGRELIAKYQHQPSMLTFIEKDIQGATDRAHAAQRGREAAAGLRRIIKESPELYKKMDIFLLHNQEEDPSFWRQKAIQLKVPKKDWANFQEAAKYTTHLLQASAKSIPAKGINVYMEKQLRKGVPSIEMVPEAANRMLNHIDNAFEHEEKVGIKKYEDASNGIWYRTPVEARNYEEGEEVSSEESAKQAEIQQLLKLKQEILSKQRLK